MKTNTNPLNMKITASALIRVWSRLRDLYEMNQHIRYELARDSDAGYLTSAQELAILRLEQVFLSLDKASTHLICAYFDVGAHRMKTGVSEKHRARKLPNREHKSKV